MNNVLGPYQEYIVKKSDSLYGIAKQFNTTVGEISDANMLTSTTIYPGQVLLIPLNPMEQNINVQEYSTEPNDTIAGIAQKLGVNPAIIGAYNDFGQLKLVENQILRIPQRNRSYTIKEGESVAKVLSETNLNAERLLELNAKEWLKIGKTIKIA